MVYNTMSRERRRRDKARMKRKARKLYPHDPNAKLADHLTTCSCAMCCNRRKIEGPTRQEKLTDDLNDESNS